MSNVLLSLDEQLVQVVTRLSKPHDVPVLGHDDHTVLGTRREPALIVQLRNAIPSSLGAGTSSGSGRAARERVPLDLGARDLLDRVTSYIRENYGRETDYHRGRRPAPEVMLDQWALRFTDRHKSRSVSDETVENELFVLQRFETAILQKLDPAPVLEITTACPVCDEQWVLLTDTGERVHCLRVTQGDPVSDSVAICLHCGAFWFGISESKNGLPTLRDLRIQIDDKARTHAS